MFIIDLFLFVINALFGVIVDSVRGLPVIVSAIFDGSVDMVENQVGDRIPAAIICGVVSLVISFVIFYLAFKQALFFTIVTVPIALLAAFYFGCIVYIVVATT